MTGLSLPLIQVGQLSVTDERMCTIKVLVNRIGLSLTRKSVVRLTDHLDMTIVVDRDVKQTNKQTKLEWFYLLFTWLLHILVPVNHDLG